MYDKIHYKLKKKIKKKNKRKEGDKNQAGKNNRYLSYFPFVFGSVLVSQSRTTSMGLR